MLANPGDPQTKDDAHLLDFGMASCYNEAIPCVAIDEGEENLAAGGGTPIYANLAQLEGRPTAPVDDIESLWYCLAYLEQGALPWQWYPRRASSPGPGPSGSRPLPLHALTSQAYPGA